MLKLVFVLKFAVTEKDILQNAMTEITLMVTDAAKIVNLKSDSAAMVDHQTQKIPVPHQSQLPSQSKTEVNQDFTEKLFLTSDLTTFQKLFYNLPMTANKTANPSLSPKLLTDSKEPDQLPLDTSQPHPTSSRSKLTSVNNPLDSFQFQFQLITISETNISLELMFLKNLH